jgi:hypothetical protein
VIHAWLSWEKPILAISCVRADPSYAGLTFWVKSQIILGE